MSLWLPPSFPGRFLDRVSITLTANATPHTKGAWTQLFASTPFDAFWVSVEFADLAAAATITSMLVDIGLGPAGSEQVLIPNLLAGAAAWNRYMGKVALLPVYVPAGSRVCARAQAAIGSDTAYVAMSLYGDPAGASEGQNTGVYAYGIDVANSRGVLVPSGSVWTEVVASTSADHRRWFALVDQGGRASLSYGSWHLDVGIGPAGGERAIGTWRFSTEGATEHVMGMAPCVPVHQPVPAGSRVAVRSAEAIGAAVYAI